MDNFNSFSSSESDGYFPGRMDKYGAIWSVFAKALKFPDSQLLESIQSGKLAEQLRLLLQEDYPDYSFGDLKALKDIGQNGGDLAQEYTRLFDCAAGGMCSLNGGLQYGPQMRTMEEVVRFYNHFGVSIADDTVETPDHLTVQLEFLYCLTYGEADRRSHGEDPAHYARARRDFIARHPGRLVSIVRGRAEELSPMPYYAELFRLLDHCLQTDRQRLESQYGAAALQEAMFTDH